MPGFSLALLLSSGAFGPATDSFLVKLLPLCSLMSPVLAGRGSVGHPPHPNKMIPLHPGHSIAGGLGRSLGNSLPLAMLSAW